MAIAENVFWSEIISKKGFDFMKKLGIITLKLDYIQGLDLQYLGPGED